MISEQRWWCDICLVMSFLHYFLEKKKKKMPPHFGLNMTCMPHVWWICCHFWTFACLSRGTFLFFYWFSFIQSAFYFLQYLVAHMVCVILKSNPLWNFCRKLLSRVISSMQNGVVSKMNMLCILVGRECWAASGILPTRLNAVHGNSNILWAKISLSCQGPSISMHKCMEFWVFVLV